MAISLSTGTGNPIPSTAIGMSENGSSTSHVCSATGVDDAAESSRVMITFCAPDKPILPLELSPAISWPPRDEAPATAACRPESKPCWWPCRSPWVDTLRFEARGLPLASWRVANGL
eukprot:3445268-Pyramimonas_sp.AAC.1